MKKYLLSVLFLLFVLVPFRAANKTDLSNELESALKLRNQYSLRKEARIDSLKRLLYPSMDDNERFRLYNAIYEEYYTYRFDSAMLYVDKEEQVAMALSHPAYRNLSIIHRSVLLSTSGYFSESIQNLEQIDSRTLNDATRIEYYAAYEWAYSMWAEYSNDKVYAPRSISSPAVRRSGKVLSKGTGRRSCECSIVCYGYVWFSIGLFKTW